MLARDYAISYFDFLVFCQLEMFYIVYTDRLYSSMQLNGNARPEKACKIDGCYLRVNYLKLVFIYLIMFRYIRTRQDCGLSTCLVLMSGMKQSIID